MLNQNYFELFGLTPRFTIDMQSLEWSFRRLQSELHPDRHASSSETERRMALQISTTLNDGYRALRHPTSRAQCLIGLAGKGEREAAVAPAFLMAQMEWREAIEEARAAGDASELETLARRLHNKMAEHEKALAAALDEQGDFDVAAQRVSELRFYEKLRTEIDIALEQMEA